MQKIHSVLFVGLSLVFMPFKALAYGPCAARLDSAFYCINTVSGVEVDLGFERNSIFATSPSSQCPNDGKKYNTGKIVLSRVDAPAEGLSADFDFTEVNGTIKSQPTSFTLNRNSQELFGQTLIIFSGETATVEFSTRLVNSSKVQFAINSTFQCRPLDGTLGKF